MITIFGYFNLIPLMGQLHKNIQHPNLIKKKVKALGGYSETDVKRSVQMRESIYSLAFASNLKNKTLDDLDLPSETRMTKAVRFEINITAFFCAFA